MANRDDLGNRMKADYENRTRYALPRRTYTLVRVDGRNFHAYTRGLERPFDAALMEDMDATTLALCAQVEGCACGYVQSDEISLLLTDFGSIKAEAWFDGSVQKIASLAASIATAAFNRARYARCGLDIPAACFDARVFTIPDPVEVENYFIWRSVDAVSNSISMAAQTVYSQEDLQGKSGAQMQEMLWRKGVNWNDYPAGCKRGRMAIKTQRRVTREFTHKMTGERQTVEVERASWEIVIPPVFTRDRQFLSALIPKIP